MYIISFICKDRSYPLYFADEEIKVQSFKLMGSYSLLVIGVDHLCGLTLNPDGPALFTNAQFTFFSFTLDYQKSMENSPGFCARVWHGKTLKGKMNSMMLTYSRDKEMEDSLLSIAMDY